MSETILVIDDDPTNLKLAVVVLTHAGFYVDQAVDAESALKMIHEEPPALILVDIRLPGMDGLEFVRRVKADPKTRRIPLVMLTGHAGQEIRIKAQEAGCDHYIPKPIDTREFPRQIAQVLKKPKKSPKPAIS